MQKKAQRALDLRKSLLNNTTTASKIFDCTFLYLRLEKFDIPLFRRKRCFSFKLRHVCSYIHLMWVCKQPSYTLQLKPSRSVSFCRNRYFHLNSFISCLPNTGALFTTTLGAQNDSTNDSNAGGHGQESCVFSALLTQSAADVWGSNPGPPLC